MNFQQIIEKLMPYLITAIIAAINFFIIYLKTRTKSLIKKLNNQEEGIKRSAIEDPKGYYSDDEIIITDEDGKQHKLTNVKFERRKKQ